MAAGEQRDQNFFDDPVLADDDLADLAEHGVAFVGKLFDLGDLMLLYLGGFHGCYDSSFSELIGAREAVQGGFSLARLFGVAEGGVDIGQ